MNCFVSVLASAQSPDVGVRRAALEYLEQESKTDPGTLFVGFARVLAENCAEESRAQAALYVKSKIKFHWDRIKLEEQRLIKDLCLSSLASTSQKTIQMAASAVSALAVLEIPKNSWPELLPLLLQTSHNPSPSYKYASLLTLGYICEETSTSCFPPNNKSQILNAILTNLTSKTEILTEQALKILKFSVSFFIEYFQKPDQCSEILSAVYSSFAYSPYLCLQVLCEIMDCCPEAFFSDLITLGTLTYAAIGSVDEKLCLMGIEVWNTAGDVEENRVLCKKPPLGYLKTACKTLTSLILPKLLMEIDEDEWSCSKSAYSTLTSIAFLCGGENFGQVFEFVKKNLEDRKDPKAVQGGLMALAAVFEVNVGEKGEVFEGFLMDCVSFLEGNGKVVGFAMRAVEKMMLNGKFRVKKEVLQEIVKKIQKVLEKTAELHAGNCLVSVVQRYKMVLDMNEFQEIIRFLLDLSRTPSRIDIFSVLIKIFEEIPEQFSALFSVFFPDVFETYSKALLNKQENLASKSSQLLQITCASLPMHKISSEDMETLMSKTIAIGIEKMKLVEDSLHLIGSISMNAGVAFGKYYAQVSPYVLHYISEVNSVDVLKAAILTIGDVARALGPAFIESFHLYIPHLVTIMEHPSLPILCKVLTINCLGDIAGAIKGGFLHVLPRVLKYIDAAAGISLNLTIEEETGESLIELRECIVQFYVGLIQGLFECGQHLSIKDRIGNLCEYLLIVVDKRYEPSVMLHESVFMLVLDLINYYREKTLARKFVQYVQQFVCETGVLGQNAKYILGLIEIC